MIWCFFCICNFLIEDVFASPALSGTYQLQTPMTELEKEKKTALERTVQSADWVYQIPISIRLKDKPHICETYVFEATETHFHVTCDSLQTLSVPISGKKEKVQRVINGKTEEIELQFHSKESEYIAYEIFSGGGSMYIDIRQSDKQSNASGKLIVSKSITSSYFMEPYTVKMIYLKK